MVSVFFLGFVGPNQLIIVLVIALLIFGGKKIPELMKGLGTGIKEFKNATKEEELNASSNVADNNATATSKEAEIKALEQEVARLKEQNSGDTSAS